MPFQVDLFYLINRIPCLDIKYKFAQTWTLLIDFFRIRNPYKLDQQKHSIDSYSNIFRDSCSYQKRTVLGWYKLCIKSHYINLVTVSMSHESHAPNNVFLSQFVWLYCLVSLRSVVISSFSTSLSSYHCD